MGVREVLLYQHFSIELSTFIAAATTIGIVGGVLVVKTLCYAWLRYTVPSIIPMIPGKYAYEMMISLVSMNTDGVTNALLSSFIEMVYMR